MSEKSRRRNKRLLALAGIITAGTLANRKPKQSDVSSDNLKRPRIETAKKDTATKSDSKMPDNLSKNTGKDNKAATPKNPYSIRTDKTPIKFGLGAQKGYTKTSIPKSTTTSGDTSKSFSFDGGAKVRAQNAERNANIRKERNPAVTGTTLPGMKSGGRAGYKHGGSTGSSKSSGCAVKGISPILMKGRK